MTREEEMITEFESEMNARLSDRDKELMISVMQWSDTHPKSKYNLSKVDSMRIKLESIESIEARTTSGNVAHNAASIKLLTRAALNLFVGIEAHPINQWHKVADGDLPPEDKKYKSWSIKVWATDGKHYGICRYDFEYHDWLYFTFKMNEVTHWMYLPTLSKEEG